MTDLDKKIILAMFENDLSVLRTAKSLFYTRQNIYNHIYKVYVETGLNCLKFYDAVKLLETIKEE